MWLFIPDGFYSVVTAKEFGEELQVRARSKADLDRLRETHFPLLGPSTSIPHRDYPWRAFTTRKAFAECLTKLALALDYSNFKDTVAHRQGRDRAHTYARVWSACRDIEREPTAEVYAP